ncbi:VOC family protein [Sandaracinobacteroides saxicola]|uniref:VOC family protein n=1 Tax=Sandaracinobacteroides saxicola TaxID=2759707 RepID=A0A7G5IE31_9SPHN|nr:VOC family protein [Sandaracinobacteroides saxicola]QMW21623.1 VOC family protein [Sandaracinobacteroides saxicola]
MIDHIFMLIDPDGPAIDRMNALGLVETYRRTHEGQGTRNVCYGFDNMFLELLWVDDPQAALSPPIRRTGLYDRSLWRTNDACPFGIAWRATTLAAEPAISTWAFSPPYLPDGMAIAVAEDSDDFRQPMMFRSPGSAPPIDWPPERRGDLQHGCGLGAVQEIVLTLPASLGPSDALKTIAADCQPHLTLTRGSAWRLEIRAEGLNGSPGLIIGLPH